MAGHDHDAFPELVVGGTRIVRPGALSRASAHRENISRKIAVALFEIDESGLKYVKYIEVPHKPFDTVFVKGDKVEKFLTMDMGEISALIQKVKKVAMTSDPFQILDMMEVRPEVKIRVESHLSQAELVRGER